MKFTTLDKNNIMAEIIFKTLRFFAYGSTKQKAGSKCISEMQEYIDSMQEKLNENLV